MSEIEPKLDHLGCLFIVYHTASEEYMYNKQMIKILIMEEDEDFNLITNILLQTGNLLIFNMKGYRQGTHLGTWHFGNWSLAKRLKLLNFAHIAALKHKICIKHTEMGLL